MWPGGSTHSPFPACPPVSFISPDKSQTGYEGIDRARLLILLLSHQRSFFFHSSPQPLIHNPIKSKWGPVLSELCGRTMPFPHHNSPSFPLPGPGAEQHRPLQRAQSRRFVSHYQGAEPEDRTPRRCQRPHWRGAVPSVSDSLPPKCPPGLSGGLCVKTLFFHPALTSRKIRSAA